MRKTVSLILISLIVTLSIVNIGGSFAAEAENKIKLIVSNMGPNFYPRPSVNATDVPLRTSIYTRLYIDNRTGSDTIDINSIQVRLIPENGDGFYILNQNQQFADGYFGELTRGNDSSRGPVVSIYIDTDKELLLGTKYTVKIEAKTVQGYGISDQDSSWSFTTEDKPAENKISRTIDFSSDFDVKWEGRYFNGFVRTNGPFDPESVKRLDFIFSKENKENYPNAFDLCRYEISSQDIYNSGIVQGYRSNFVREKETRRIISVTAQENGVLIKTEDFFGHQQYGIESDRPLSEDYNPGDEIMIVDKDKTRYATVISVNDKDRSVLVSQFDQPANSWDIEYFAALPAEENPYAPGLFPKGGTYLTKFNPAGTPVYYWDRLDAILDMYVERYGQRMSLNIIDAYGDLSVDGRNANHPKDYVEFHKVTYDVVTHLIERYGERTTTWVWSIFNEPDLMGMSWRSRDWIELQKFYDYAVDAILKAFEDAGFDSHKIMIGGLELGGIFGTNLRLHDFLAHCSPTAKKHSSDTLDYNAAYADPRLDGKRSRRVEELCAANNGKGTPLDFVSVHAYNTSDIAAAKFIHTKQTALEIDPEFYRDLWVNNYETMPTWSGFDDPGCTEWTLGNGYLPTWAADYFSRMLNKASEDPRFCNGDSVLTIWGWPQRMFNAQNDVVFEAQYRSGRNLERVILPKPIFHYLCLISTMDTNYWVIPQETVGGHNLSGFAANGENDLRMVLYSHNIYDTQCRSDAEFSFDLDLKGLKWKNVKVTEYRFDRSNNTYHSFAVENRNKTTLNEKELDALKELTELRVSGEEVYQVNSDGSLKLNLPVAANGVNFVVLSDADAEETPPEDTPPEDTPPEDTPPEDTPPEDTPPEDTHTPSPADTEKPTESETPAETEEPVETVVESPMETEKPDKSPVTNDKGIFAALLFVLISGVLVYITSKLRYKIN